jgi:hypothetical protein
MAVTVVCSLAIRDRGIARRYTALKIRMSRAHPSIDDIDANALPCIVVLIGEIQGEGLLVDSV